MKISKLILICSLSSLANAAFADPILISCSFDSDKVTYRPKVEFDDQNPRTISVDGKPIYYNSYTKIGDHNAKLLDFNSSTIAWCTSWAGKSFCYDVNRKTGMITYNYHSDIYQSTDRGSCTKIRESSGF